MPITKSVKKSLRQSETKRKRNSGFKVNLKKTIKSFLAKPDQKGLKTVYSMLDKAGKNHIYHKNKVNRLKSNFSKKIEKVASKKTVKKTVKKPTKKKAGSKMPKAK